MQKFLLIALFVLVGNFQSANSQMIQFHENWPVHEAFATPQSQVIIYKAILNEPPQPLVEKIPKQQDMQAIWIPGFWAWEAEAKDFVWVSGVWRRPPPAHQWISGFWKKEPEGYVWFPGFWSLADLEKLNTIGTAPPDDLEENVSLPSSNDYFWVPGYWNFSFETHTYDWVKGQWEAFDPNWIFIPSYYVFRPHGYVFVPAYWDFPLEDRGTAYAAVFVAPDYRKGAVYEPSKVLSPEGIIQALYVYYPDHLTLFHHYWVYNPSFWQKFCCVPPWWKWQTWWTFNNHNNWALWWWYAHPGYPQPEWMTEELSALLPVPSHETLALFQGVVSPAIITPQGVLSETQALEAIKKTTGSFNPLFPANPAMANKIFKMATKRQETAILQPTGRHLPINPNAQRPIVKKPQIEENDAIPSNNLHPLIPHKPKWQNSKANRQGHIKSLEYPRSDWTPEKSEEKPLPEKPLKPLKNWKRMEAYKNPSLFRYSAPAIVYKSPSKETEKKVAEDIQIDQRIDRWVEERALEKKREEEAVERKLWEKHHQDRKRAEQKMLDDRRNR